jgi:hypothetical protein
VPDDLPHPPDGTTEADLDAWEALSRKAPPEVRIVLETATQDVLQGVEAALAALDAWDATVGDGMDRLLEKASENLMVPHPSEPPPFDWGSVPAIAQRPPGQARSIMVLVDLFDPIGRDVMQAYSRTLFLVGRFPAAIALQDHLEATQKEYERECTLRDLASLAGTEQDAAEHWGPHGDWWDKGPFTVTPPEEDQGHVN